MKVILGIDPGLASTGYGIIQCAGSRFRCIVHGTIRTSPRDGVGERLVQIHRGVTDIDISAGVGVAAVLGVTLENPVKSYLYNPIVIVPPRRNMGR